MRRLTSALNIPRMPTKTPKGYLWPGSGPLLNPNAGAIRAIFWEGNSSYHSLQSQLIKKMSHGVQFQASYTWSKSIDINSATLVGDAFGNSIPSLHWFDTNLSRGLSDFNVAHSLVVNTLWQVPGIHGTSPIGWAANGWELGGIFKANTGVPFTAILGGDPLGLNSGDPYAFPNRLNSPGCGSLVNPGNAASYVKTECFGFPHPSTLRGNEGRNVLIDPGTSNLDFMVFKNNRISRISESFNAQLRVEVFNILNHANSRIEGAGLLDSTTTSSRQIQFALKLIW